MEAVEAGFWIELIVEGNLLPDNFCVDLHKEADELRVRGQMRNAKSQMPNWRYPHRELHPSLQIEGLRS